MNGASEPQFDTIICRRRLLRAVITSAFNSSRMNASAFETTFGRRGWPARAGRPGFERVGSGAPPCGPRTAVCVSVSGQQGACVPGAAHERRADGLPQGAAGETGMRVLEPDCPDRRLSTAAAWPPAVLRPLPRLLRLLRRTDSGRLPSTRIMLAQISH